MPQHSGPIGRTVEDVRDYASLYVDRLKLGLIEHLSLLFNRMFALFLFIILLSIGVLFFAVALIWLLATVLQSLLAAVLLMGGLFVFLALVIFLLRRRLILNRMVRLFSRMFDDINKNTVDYE